MPQRLAKPLFRAPSTRTGRGTLCRWLGWFAWLNAVLATVIALRFVPYMGPLDSLLAQAYLAAAMFGHFGVLALLPSLLLLPLAVLVPRRAVIVSLAVVVAGAAQLLLAIDTVVYDYYRFHLNAFVLALVWDAGQDVFDFSWLTWLVAVAAGVAILALQVLFVSLAWRRASAPRRPRLGLYAAAVLAAAVVSSHLLHIWADATYRREITSLSRHLPLYRPSSAKSFLARRGWVDVEKHRRMRPPLADDTSELDYPRNPLECSAPGARANLLWVVIDTWRQDAYAPAFTPNLSAFAERYPVSRFDDHISGGNGTRPGVFSMFYALPASYWRAFYGAERGPVLISALLEAGYEPGIFSAARLTRPAFDRTVFSQIPNLRLRSEGDTAWQRDRSLVRDWGAFLETRDRDRPFFGYLHFDSVHGYTFPPDYPRHFAPLWERVDHLALDDDFDPLPYRNRYNQAVHYVDSLLGPVLDDLEQRELLGDTVILVTSDHGAEFNESGLGYWGHGGNYSRYQTMVPLLLHWPGRPARRYTHTSNHYDLVPTLMRELLGCSNAYEDYSIGRSLFDESPRESTLVSGHLQYGIVERDRISVLYQSGDFEVFDRDYRRLEGAELSPAVSRAVLEDMSRFYR